MDLLNMIYLFLVTNIASFIVIVGILFIFAIMIKAGQKKKVYKIIYELVCAAEKEYGDRTGDIKYGYVVRRFYSYLPLAIRLLFREKDLSEMIDLAVQELKKRLVTGEITLDGL